MLDPLCVEIVEIRLLAVIYKIIRTCTIGGDDGKIKIENERTIVYIPTWSRFIVMVTLDLRPPAIDVRGKATPTGLHDLH